MQQTAQGIHEKFVKFVLGQGGGDSRHQHDYIQEGLQRRATKFVDFDVYDVLYLKKESRCCHEPGRVMYPRHVTVVAEVYVSVSAPFQQVAQ